MEAILFVPFGDIIRFSLGWLLMCAFIFVIWRASQ